LLEFFFDRAIDPGGFVAEMPKFAKRSHPGLAVSVVSPKLVADSFRNKHAERSPAPSGCGPARRNIESGISSIIFMRPCSHIHWLDGKVNFVF